MYGYYREKLRAHDFCKLKGKEALIAITFCAMSLFSVQRDPRGRGEAGKLYYKIFTILFSNDSSWCFLSGCLVFCISFCNCCKKIKRNYHLQTASVPTSRSALLCIWGLCKNSCWVLTKTMKLLFAVVVAMTMIIITITMMIKLQ